MQRRTMLRALGAAITTATAGCGQNGDQPTAPDTASSTPTNTATATATPSRTTTTEPTPTDTPTATPTETPAGTPTSTPDATIVVGPRSGGSTDFRFVPDSISVATGDTVRWTWDSGGHNIVPNDRPAESEWTGTPDGAGTTYGEGYVYQHRFTVAGSYSYYCAPHRSLGMTGSLTVE